MVNFPTTPLPVGVRPGPIHLAGLMSVGPGEFRWRVPYWALLLAHYEADLTLGGHALHVTPGAVTFIVPGLPKWCRYERSGSHHVIHFAAPFPDDDAPRVPLAFDPGPLGPAVLERFKLVCRTARTDPHRAGVALWDLLYLLGDVHGPDHPQPLIERFTAALDERLHTAFSIGDLVGEFNYSHTHLLGLFRERHGETIVGYVRRRRMEDAKAMLGTDLPITVIATQVGIPDLQAFNKTVRRTFGCSPRALREQLRREAMGSDDAHGGSEARPNPAPARSLFGGNVLSRRSQPTPTVFKDGVAPRRSATRGATALSVDGTSC